MERLNRIYQIHKLLSGSRRPVAMLTLCEQLECSQSSIRREIGSLRSLGAPILYDRKNNGYCMHHQPGEPPFELPGLWFNESELHALLICQHLLTHIQPGLFDHHIAPLKTRIEKLLQNQPTGNQEIKHRIRILQTANRAAQPHHFHKIASALIQRQQLRILYHSRSRDETTERHISPQRLIHYRDNWYLDAWCHSRNDLRTFALDRIHPVITSHNQALNISDTQLDHYFTRTYGIFSGEPRHTAILRFNPQAARWVSDEHWHPQQQSQTLADGSLQLHIPYDNPTELIMDILKYGPDVTVIAPAELQQQILAKLRASLKNYHAIKHTVSG